MSVAVFAEPKNKRSHYHGVAMMMRCLLDGPSEIKELVDISGLAESTVRMWIKAMIECYVVRIGLHVGGMGTPLRYVYELNPEYLEGSERPAPLTRAERAKRRRAHNRLELINSIRRASNGLD